MPSGAAADVKDRAGARSEGAEGPPEPTGAENQRRVRCDIAEQQAREHWVKHKAEILASIKDVGTESWVSAERRKDLERMTKTLGADRSEVHRFDQGYDALWAKYGPTFQSQIKTEPTDAALLIDTVRGFWRDEDRMVETIMGGQAKDEYRASEMRSRTAIVAILAAFAEKPFDDALVW